MYSYKQNNKRKHLETSVIMIFSFESLNIKLYFSQLLSSGEWTVFYTLGNIPIVFQHSVDKTDKSVD